MFLLTPLRCEPRGAHLLASVIALLTCTLRLGCLWARLLRSVAEVGLWLRPSLYDQRDLYKQECSAGPVTNRRERERFCRVLQQAEAEGLLPREAARCLDFSAGVDLQDTTAELFLFGLHSSPSCIMHPH